MTSTSLPHATSQAAPWMNSAFSTTESQSQIWFPIFSSQNSIFGMTNINMYFVLKVVVAVFIFNRSSPLFSVHQPVCGMASFCFLHAPFSIVSISCAFSSRHNLCSCLFFRLIVMTQDGKQRKDTNMWSCSAAEHTTVVSGTAACCILPSKPRTLMQLFQRLWFWQRGNAIILIKHMQD